MELSGAAGASGSRIFAIFAQKRRAPTGMALARTGAMVHGSFTRLLVAALSSAMLAAAACSSSSDPGTAGVTPGSHAEADAAGSEPLDVAAIAEICKPFARAGELAQQCCSAEELSRSGSGMMGTLLELSTECESWLSARIASGRVEIDANQFEACNTEMPEPTCALFGGASEVAFCRDAVRGLGGVGDPCLFAVECADGLTCLDYSSVKAGTCGEPPAVGEVCYPLSSGLESKHLLDDWLGAHPLCAAGARCSNFAMGSTGQCVAQLSEGEWCIEDGECLAPLRCSLGICSANPSPPAGPGGECRYDSDCGSNLVCDRSLEAPVCVAPKPAGEPCEPLSDICRGECVESSAGAVCASFCGSG